MGIFMVIQTFVWNPSVRMGQELFVDETYCVCGSVVPPTPSLRFCSTKLPDYSARMCCVSQLWRTFRHSGVTVCVCAYPCTKVGGDGT